MPDLPDDLQLVRIDWATHRCTLTRRDGTSISAPLDPPEATPFASSVLDLDQHSLRIVTTRGDSVLLDLYDPHKGNDSRTHMVVYLDQNHWRTVADASADPSAIRKRSEVEPAQRLVDGVNTGDVIIPLSSSNLLETSRLADELRYSIGLTMSRISHGWQLRHPATVQRQEVGAILARKLGRPVPEKSTRPVVTLEPGAIHPDMRTDLPPNGGLLAAVRDAMALVAVALDPERIPREDAHGWVQENQQFSDYLASRPDLSGSTKRELSYTRTAYHDLLHDIMTELPRLEPSPEEQQDLARIPAQQFLRGGTMLPLFAHLMMLRHTNPHTRWKPNDLVDAMTLSTAAAYCDFVACEKHTAEQLRQAQRALGRPVTAFNSLSTLVEHMSHKPTA